jgi:type II secretory pathway component PulF
MGWISRFYEEEVDTTIDTALTLFEPLLMAGMGILVAVTLLGTMLPMVKVLEAL